MEAGRADRVRRFILIAEKNSAAESRIVNQDATVIGLWNFGILFLRSLRVTGMEDMKDFQNRISILEWDLKDLPALCRG